MRKLGRNLKVKVLWQLLSHTRNKRKEANKNKEKITLESKKKKKKLKSYEMREKR